MQKHDQRTGITNLHLSNKKFPSILLLQMDNCVDDNKNCYVFAFLSLLTSRRVFEIIEVGFLFVGHTHEDIDGTYNRVLAKRRQKTYFIYRI